MRIEDLDTPALLVDLDGLEDNLDRYQRYFDEHGIGLRPHIKTHKCVAIAHMQMRRGAIGITCQKLGEAEVMAEGGVDRDILIPYNIIGAQKLARLVALARDTRLTVAADSEYTVQGLAEAATAADVTVGVVVELDRGRTGVGSPAAAAALGEKIDQAPNIELRGIMSMPATPDMRPLIQETLAHFDRKGLPHPIVSGGSTSGAFMAHEIPELTEYRAGEYPVGGVGHLRRGTHSVEQCAGRVLMTVVSRPTAESRHPRRGQQVAQRRSPSRGGRLVHHGPYRRVSPSRLLRGLGRTWTCRSVGLRRQTPNRRTGAGLAGSSLPLFQRTRPDLCRAPRPRGSRLAG